VAPPAVASSALAGAPAMVAGSAFLAAVMSLQAGKLSVAGVPSFTTAAVCGAVAASVCVLWEGMFPHLPAGSGQGSYSVAWAAQSFLGGLLPHLAFFAISRAGLAVANTLMFTMPLWTGIFAWLCLGKPWRTSDVMGSVLAMLGVVLVTKPPMLFAGSTGATAAFSATGCAAGLAFGACGGALNLLVSAKLRGASPATLTAGQMAMALGLSVPMLVRARGSLLGGTTLFGPAGARLVSVGLLMAAMNLLRTLGMQRAKSTAVATLLYTEIAWCFLFEVAFLTGQCAPLQLLGAALIVSGAATSAASGADS